VAPGAIHTIELEQVEEHNPVLTPVAQPVEGRQAIITTGHRFAIDQARPHLSASTAAAIRG
jgi:hypothetical protein